MKKTVIIGASIMMLSVFACRKPDKVIETHPLPTAEATAAPAASPLNVVDPTIMPSSSDWHNDPPKRPIFNDIEKYTLLASAVELDDVECERILYHYFVDDGIDTKADAIKTLEIINSLPFPAANGLKLIGVELADYRDGFDILYGIEGDEEGFIDFDISLTSSDAEAQRKALEQSYPLVKLPETRSSELKYLARAGSNPSGVPGFQAPILKFITNIRSHKVTIQTSLSEEEFLDILANCEIITMDEYAKKANP